jgi:hypothetical protein
MTEHATVDGEERERIAVVRFLGIPVFRFEDTDGAPLEIADYKPAELPPLMDSAERLGVAVSWVPFDRYRGWYRPQTGTITLCS